MRRVGPRCARPRLTVDAAMTVYPALSGEKTEGNLLFVLEPARYESVATHMTKRPADQPEADGFVLGVLRMEPMAKRWLGLPAINIPPGIDVYVSANGKALRPFVRVPPRPVRERCGVVDDPRRRSRPSAAHGRRRSSRLPTRTSRWCSSPQQAISPSLEPGSLS